MFEELSDITTEMNRIVNLDADAKTRLSKVSELREIAQTRLDKQWEEYDKLVSEGEATPPAEAALTEATNKANMILLEKMEEAIVRNQEFSVGYFLDRLTAVCLNPESISIIPVSDTEIAVTINLNETAGTLSDYADGINAVRDRLNSNKKSGLVTSREMASHFWREKFYGARMGGKIVRRKWNKSTKSYDERDVTDEQRAKYWDTILARLDASGKIAPFWEILDQGTVPLASDDGGTPYPKNIRTNFTGKAIQAIKNLFKNTMASGKRESKGNISEVKAGIDATREVLKEIDYSIDKLGNLSLEFIDLEEKRLGNELNNLVNVKMISTEDAIKRVKEGHQARVTVGYTSEGKQIQMRYKKWLSAQLEAE
jgi:hypothetical protein